MDARASLSARTRTLTRRAREAIMQRGELRRCLPALAPAPTSQRVNQTSQDFDSEATTDTKIRMDLDPPVPAHYGRIRTLSQGKRSCDAVKKTLTGPCSHSLIAMTHSGSAISV